MASFIEAVCCVGRSKSAERREYEMLREALAKKQEEVRRLQAQCAAHTAHTAPPASPRGPLEPPESELEADEQLGSDALGATDEGEYSASDAR